jgi:hypothetical protein
MLEYSTNNVVIHHEVEPAVYAILDFQGSVPISSLQRLFSAKIHSNLMCLSRL